MPEANDEEARNRLHGIVVHEVSLVDRAANKRRFLVVKRSEPMTKSEKEAEAKAKKEAEEKAKAEAEAKAKAEADAKAKDKDKKDRAAKQEGEEDGEAPPALSLPAEAKATMTRMLAEMLERMVGLANSVKAAQEDDSAPPMPESVASELSALGDMLKGMMELGAAGGGEEEEKSAGFDDDTKGSLRDAGFDDDMIGALETLVGKDAKNVKEKPEDKEKAKKQIGKLADLLADVPSIAPTKKNATGSAGPDKQAIEKLLVMNEKLMAKVTKQGEEIDSLRKAGGASQALTVEHEGGTEDADVAWPMDMNRPINRDTVEKDVSFFD